MASMDQRRSLPSIDPAVAALDRAVRIIGGQTATAKLLGLSQTAVWKWINLSRPLPAEHVLKVEAATGISRHDLRPDIYPLVETASFSPPARDPLGQPPVHAPVNRAGGSSPSLDSATADVLAGVRA